MKEHHRLSHSPRTHWMLVEFTTRCNFKCTYCAVSQPTWKPRDMDFYEISYQSLLQQAVQRDVKIVNLHGHGETTILPNWRELVEQARTTGARLMLCSNFGRMHTDEDTATFASLQHLTVSIDTVDHELFKRLRRGGDLRTLIYNMTRLQSKIREQGFGPFVSWSVVLSDLNWRGLPNLVRQGIDLGVGVFGLCNLHVLPVPDGGTVLRHVSELDSTEAAAVKDTLLWCRQYCHERGAAFDIKSGILDTLDRKISS